MKIKEIERTAIVAWSPRGQHPVYLASGTAAQQLDATFSTKSAVEIFRFNPEEPGFDCELVATAESEHRFNKIIWGNLGMSDGGHSSGVVVGGTDNGLVCVWDGSKLVMQESDSQILTLKKHVGSVGALDFNKFQDNLLASGGSDSEIFLWDLNNPTTPMTPGAKSQPSDEVTCLSWNCQVQHILASTLNTRCVVWDLRKSEPIIKISDSMSRIKSKLVTWHPEIATQLVLSSEDDHAPVIQLWDLRFAASPLKVLEKHSRGILSMAWSRQDPDLLISSGKDNRLICWNPNTDAVGGEVTYELPIGNQWCFDVQWCPRNPQCLSACSFDGRVSVYSIMGGVMSTQTLSATNKIADSFDGFDSVMPAQSVPKVEQQVVPQIAKAPKWLKRPCGASFAILPFATGALLATDLILRGDQIHRATFGGKLVSFVNTRSTDPSGQSGHKQVSIHKVANEREIITQSTQLEHALHNRQFAEFCSLKIANSKQEKEETLWQFLRVNFENDPRNKYLNILGFDAHEISQKIASATSSGEDLTENDLSSKMNELSSAGDVVANGSQSAAADAFDQLSQPASISKELHLDTTEGSGSLLTQALLTGNFEQAVELCLYEERFADAIILANADSPSLLERTMKRYFKQSTGSTSTLISAVVQKDYKCIIGNVSLENWKEALAVILTYGKTAEFAQLCDLLGNRLEQSPHAELSSNAVLCYICSGNIDKFVDCWLKQTPEISSSSASLQELIEKVMMLRKAVEQLHGQEYSIPASSSLANKLGQYAELLAAEGSLQTALSYLGGVAQSQKLSVLKHRLQMALGQHVTSSPWPKMEIASAISQQVHQSKQHNTPRSNSNPYGQANKPQPSNTAYAQPHHQYGTGGQSHQPAAPAATSSYYNGQPQPFNPSYSSYNGGAGTAAVTTTTSAHGSYGSQPQPTYQPNYNVAANYSHPTVPGAGYQPSPQPAPSHPYGGGYGGGYGGYAAAQPVGHVSARGLLSKKYAAAGTTASSASDTSQSLSSGQPVQSYYNPNTVNTSPAISTGMAGSYNPGGTYAPADTYNSTTPAEKNSVRTMGRLSRRLSYEAGMPNTVTPYQMANQQYSQVAAPSVSIPSMDDARSAPSGWNDPPAVHGKEPESPKATSKAAPITMPVFNPVAQQQVMGDPMYGGQYYPNTGQQQQYYSGQPQTQSQHYPPAASLSPKQSAPPVEVVKAPIPEKHMVLKDTLDSLAKKCLHASNNPQQKRKLEDVVKKLEYLYDKLRNQALSDSILTGLHQIVSSIKQYDYQAGLTVHTNLVYQGNFSEISAFMPGLKMLMQTAYQLQVFV